MRINGTDYPTADGTCIRDYVQVDDLANAHLDALAHLRWGGSSTVCNCGYGFGRSVHEVIDMVKEVSSVDVKVGGGPRRADDPAKLVAAMTKSKKPAWLAPGA